MSEKERELSLVPRLAIASIPREFPPEVLSELSDGVIEGIIHAPSSCTREHMNSLLSSFAPDIPWGAFERDWWASLAKHRIAFLGSRRAIERAWTGMWLFDRRLAVLVALELIVRWGRLGWAQRPKTSRILLLAREWARSPSEQIESEIRNSLRGQMMRGPCPLIVDMITFARDISASALREHGSAFRSSMAHADSICDGALACFPEAPDYVPSIEFAAAFEGAANSCAQGKVIELRFGVPAMYSRDEQYEIE